jgi:type II secretory pathway component PulJ
VGITEFIANVQREKDASEKAMKQEAEKQRITGVLDPVTVSLVDYQDAQDLLDKTDAIYDRLDEDCSGGLTFEEFKAGLTRLPCAGNIHFTEDDFEIITEYGRLLHSPAKPEFNKMQFRDMMQNELFRFARRNLANALRESEGEEFRQLVLMLKLMETNLASKLEKTATCSCKAAPEGDLRTMRLLESVVQGQQDLQKQFLELASRLNNSQSVGTNHQAQIVNAFEYRETRGVADRLCSTPPRAVSQTAAPETAPSRQKEVVSLTRGALEAHQNNQKMILEPFENEIDMVMSHVTVDFVRPEEDIAVDSSETTCIPMLRSRVRQDQSKHVKDALPHPPHLSNWPLAAPKVEDEQYLPKDRELSEANDIQIIINETGLLEAKKSSLLERLKLRREHQSLKRFSAFDDLDNNASQLDRSQRRTPPTDFPRTCPAEMTKTWSGNDQDLVRPADDMEDGFERKTSRHRSRQDKSNPVQHEQYLPREQENLSLLAPQDRPIGGHAVQQLQLHRAQSNKSRLSPSNYVQDEYSPKDQEFWPLPALQNKLKRAQSLKNASEMTPTLVFKSDLKTQVLDQNAALLDRATDRSRRNRKDPTNVYATCDSTSPRGQDSGNDQVFECSWAAQFEHY